MVANDTYAIFVVSVAIYVISCRAMMDNHGDRQTEEKGLHHDS